MSNSLDVYPSTYDYAGGVTPLLNLVENARERYLRNSVMNGYIRSGGGVCAIGAVWTADAVDWSSAKSEWHESLKKATHALTVQEFVVEKKLSDTAKEAMKLLDATVVELYPKFASHGLWIGPLEALNQWTPFGKTLLDNGSVPFNKDKVLRVYDLVIERLKARKGEMDEIDEAESWGTPIEAEPEHEPVVPPELAKI